MAGFLYFLPGATGAGPDAIEAAGLTDVLSGASHPTRGVTGAGPSGGPGIITVPHPTGTGAAPQIGFYSDKQEWQEAPGGKYWIGREIAEPVTPADLARPEMIGGHLVELGDGNKWLIPVARAFPHGIVLPQTLRLGPDGELVGETLPKYAAFSTRAEMIWDEWKAQMAALEAGEDREPGITVTQQWEFAVDAIAINYRINAVGASMLGIINTAVLPTVLQAVIDVPTLVQAAAEMAEAEAKKNDTPDAQAAG